MGLMLDTERWVEIGLVGVTVLLSSIPIYSTLRVTRGTYFLDVDEQSPYALG